MWSWFSIEKRVGRQTCLQVLRKYVTMEKIRVVYYSMIGSILLSLGRDYVDGVESHYSKLDRRSWVVKATGVLHSSIGSELA
jgi:hypothetical protein